MSCQTEPVWASYHLFYHGSGDRLLSRLVLPAVRDLWERRYILRFFFIRYGLGGPHIRLRLLCGPGHRTAVDGILRQAAAEFFTQWPSETQLDADEIRRRNQRFSANDDTCVSDAVYPNNSVVELPFQPEVERYGGPGFIVPSLDFFGVSSAYVLRLVEQHDGEPRPRRLSRALRALLRQALGFAADGDTLPRLAAYAAVGNGNGRALLLARADEEFDRCREDYVGLVREEIESSRDPSARARLADAMLIEAARVLGWRIRDAAGPVWWQIVGSQLHMTANRMGLMNVEEIYLGHILRRALESAGAGRLSSPGSSATEPGIPGDDALEALAAASLDQLSGE